MPDPTKKKQDAPYFTMRCEPKLRKQLETAAKAHQRPVSWIVRKAAQEWLERNKEEK